MQQIRLAVLISFLVLFLGVACSASSDGYIQLESIDREQSYKFDILDIEIWEARTIDTVCLKQMQDSFYFVNDVFSESLIVTTDSNRSVLSVTRNTHGEDHAVRLKLYFELDKKEITRLFLVERTGPTAFWELVESIATVIPNNSNWIKINAVLKVRMYQGAGTIRFPYNDKGLYDWDIDRYIMIECVIPMNERLKRIFK